MGELTKPMSNRRREEDELSGEQWEVSVHRVAEKLADVLGKETRIAMHTAHDGYTAQTSERRA